MSARIINAQASVTDARKALIDTARELQQRLAPRTLARDAWESAKVKGADLAEDAVDAVKRRPVATGGIVAAVAMFLAREPIKQGVSRLYDAMTSEDHEPEPKAKAPAPKPTPRRKRSVPRPARKTETK